MARSIRVAGVLVLAAALLSACGDAPPSPSLTPSPAPSVSPTGTPTPTVDPSPWQLVPGDCTMSGPDHTGPCVPEVDLPMNADGTAGSGCTPPSDDTLPDGLWFGYLTEATADDITFDLACSYHFDSEQHLANLEGSELETYTWTNDDPGTRDLGVSGGAGYYAEWEWIPWTEAPLDSPSLLGPVWIAINSGEVTEIAVPVYS